jgi:oligoribonuclease NrnB/cAMP/cGMP phosphodiesterase (DHH superfamily)
MLEECARLVYIDHHKGAIEDMATLIQDGYIEALVAQEHSGAVLAWKYWNKTEHEMPALLRHIEDRDLWRFALAHTREIQANVFSYPYDFEVWDTLMKTPIDDLVRDGIALERKHMKDIRELLEVTERSMIIGGVEVPVANLPYTMSSDAAQMLATMRKAPFAACYFDTADGRSFSLRSPAGGMNVCAIAQQYGGGGHVHASGFSVPSSHLLAIM